MATYSITITDAAKVAGIGKARQAYNDALPIVEEKDEEGNVTSTSKPGELTTDQAYVQFVMDNAADSYAKQYR